MGAGLLAAACALASPAHGQTVTAITPDAPGSPLATGTTVTGAGAIKTIDGGTLSGANLFHSFSTFDLAAGETARWATSLTDPATIANVINRVTGGGISHIDGTLNSTALPNAAFTFINPAGIVFGAGATVNVPASAFFSSAQTLRFADGATFSATTANGSTFSAAPIASFGFLGGQGAIRATDTANLLAQQRPLALIASDISFDNAFASTAGIALVAIGSGAANFDPLRPSTGLTGAVTLTNSGITTRTANGDGSILVAGGSVRFDGSSLGSTAVGGTNAGDFAIVADTIALANGAFLSTVTNAAGNAGNLSLTARNVTLDNATVLSRAGAAATGQSGAIRVTANTLAIRNLGALSVTTLGAGATGMIAVNADSVAIDNGFVTSNANVGSTGPGGMIAINTRLLNASASTLSANAYGSGNAGSVSVAATGTIALDNTYILSNANAGATGNAGAVSVQAPVMTMANDSRITSGTFASGNAGTIGIAVADLRLDNSRIITNANPGSSGAAGTVSIASNTLALANGSAIASSTQGSGAAGAVLLQTRDLTMSGASSIRTSEQIGGTGDAGRIAIAATGTIKLSDFAVIESATVGTGNAGAVTVSANALNLDSATIGTDAFAGSNGNAGSLIVTANSILATNGSVIRSSTVGTGNAGSVAVNADGGTISLDSYALIGSDALSLSTGNAGTVSVSAASLIVGRNAFVSSDVLGTGNAGSVTIKAGSTIVDGGSISSQAYPRTIGNAGTVTIQSNTIVARNAGQIASSTYGSGNAGAVDLSGTSLTVDTNAIVTTLTNDQGRAGIVSLDFEKITLTGGGQITSDTYGSGNAGNVRISVADLKLTGATIASRAYATSTGNAGSVSVAATRTIALDGGASITTSTQSSGTAGAVSLSAPAIALAGGAAVSSNALNARVGTSGSVAIAADSLAITGGAQVQTISYNGNPGGSVDVTAPNLLIAGANSAISTANAHAIVPTAGLAPGAYSAGAVRVGTTYLTIRDGATISSNSLSGPAGDLTITMPFKVGILFLSSAGPTSTITTSSGPGTGGRITIASPLAVISNGGAIRAQGAQGGANVLIASTYFIGSADRTNVIAVDGAFKLDSNIYDVSNGTAVPTVEYLDASKVLSGQCASARAQGVASRLSARATGPYSVGTAIVPAGTPGGCT